MHRTLRTIILLSCLLSGAVTLLAQSDKQKELEAKRAQIQQEIREINSLLFKSKKEEKSVLEQVESLDHRIRATENLIRVTNQQANLLTREINNRSEEHTSELQSRGHLVCRLPPEKKTTNRRRAQ